VLSLIVTGAVFIAISSKKSSYGKSVIFKVTKQSYLAFFCLLIGIFGFVTQVDANMVGIVYDPFNGGVQDATLSEGIHWISPFQKITKITTKNRTRQVRTFGQTEDAIYAEFQMTIIYKIETTSAGHFFRATSAPDIGDNEFQSMVKEALQRNAVKFDIYEILGRDLDLLRSETEADLKDIFQTRYAITIVSLSLDDVDAGTQIEQIIQNKAQAIQQIEIAQKEKEKAEIDALTLLVQAQAQADALLIGKQAEAEAIELIANANAEAIKSKLQEVLLTLGLDPSVGMTEAELKIVVEYMAYLEYLVVWNGELPTVVTDGTTGFILNIQP
jgi:regulator of protease activity HflC (stomatin/prohibitin superfamily)